MRSFTFLFALSYGSVLEDAAIKGVNLVAEVESEIHRLLDGGDATTEVPAPLEEISDSATPTVEETLETVLVSQTTAEISETETAVVVSQSTVTVAEMRTEVTTTDTTTEETITMSSSLVSEIGADKSVSTVSPSVTQVASNSTETLQSSEATLEETTPEEGGFLATTRKRNSATRFGGVLASIAVALL
ncbi:MAG: hypothetical protein KVP17_004236 [Porospora cf. gigantea B]|uniref:uncharacterized protein n=1 Tax=Porospora cf. gigantea B TaxID=2853592 RepID=UPI003571D394|nr:MAG: hypothetical protein KVP17_004236 [Porospora cf. gigantea B]